MQKKVGNRKQFRDYYRLDMAVYLWDVKALHENDDI